ncbi:MAG: FixH family protein [Gammaproteobacteria bacterium]|jgi:nitrogen fixation protein FixH
MSSLVTSLGIGVGLAFLAFVLIYKFTPLRGKQVSLIVSMGAMLAFLPYAITHWEGLDVLAVHIAFYLVVPYVLGIITSTWEMREQHEGKDENARWFHWAPTIIVLFFLGLATVDAVIVTLSSKGLSQHMAALLLPKPDEGVKVTSYFPGTVLHNYQMKEGQYDAYLARMKQQAALHWTVKKGFSDKPMANRKQVFEVEILDRDGVPVTGAHVEANFLRASNERLDQIHVLKEMRPGLYRGQVMLPLPGYWDVFLRINHGKDSYEDKAMTEVFKAPGRTS